MRGLPTFLRSRLPTRMAAWSRIRNAPRKIRFNGRPQKAPTIPAGPEALSGALCALCRPVGLSNQVEGGAGWGGRIRTYGTRYQKALPYRLATPHQQGGGYDKLRGASSPRSHFFRTILTDRHPEEDRGCRRYAFRLQSWLLGRFHGSNRRRFRCHSRGRGVRGGGRIW